MATTAINKFTDCKVCMWIASGQAKQEGSTTRNGDVENKGELSVGKWEHHQGKKSKGSPSQREKLCCTKSTRTKIFFFFFFCATCNI